MWRFQIASHFNESLTRVTSLNSVTLKWVERKKIISISWIVLFLLRHHRMSEVSGSLNSYLQKSLDEDEFNSGVFTCNHGTCKYILRPITQCNFDLIDSIDCNRNLHFQVKVWFVFPFHFTVLKIQFYTLFFVELNQRHWCHSSSFFLPFISNLFGHL